MHSYCEPFSFSTSESAIRCPLFRSYLVQDNRSLGETLHRGIDILSESRAYESNWRRDARDNELRIVILETKKVVSFSFASLRVTERNGNCYFGRVADERRI